MLDAAVKRRILLFPINGPKRVVENEQLKARGLFVDIKPPGVATPVKFPGPPLKSTAPLWRPPSPAPRAGQHTAQVLREAARWKPTVYGPTSPKVKRALEGITVADFTWLVAGPTVSKYLAIFGATVVKVESSTRLDGTRQTGPFAGKPTFNSSAQFANHNTSKLSLGVNMSDPRGLEVARKLATWADVVVENFTPGVMAKWSLGYDDIRKANPGVVMLSTSFQGQTGPAATQSGYASLLHALCGINHVTGWPDLPPVDLGAAYGDLIGVWFAIATVVAALDRRSKTGEGVAIDLSQFESSIHFLAPAILDYTVNGREWARQGNRSDVAAPHNVYRCADNPAAGAAANDRWCAIACYTEQEWQTLCRAMGKPSLAKEPRFATQALRRQNADALNALIDAWTSSRKAEDVMRYMQRAGVPAGTVASGYDLHADAQMRHRGHMVKLEHAQMGLRTYDAPSFRLSRTPHEMRAAPLLGEHTHHVVTSLLGMSDAEYAELLGAGVLEQES
jgi:benzylsuccinate CoA-transferase BbsF subunit